MLFSSEDIRSAYFSCPLPTDDDSSCFGEYQVIMEIICRELKELRGSLSREQYELVGRCFENFHLFTDIISSYYFQQGWSAAKKDSRLDRYL